MFELFGAKRRSIVSLVLLVSYCCWCCASGSSTRLHGTGAITCRDEDGEPIDWFIAYKFPMLSNDRKPFSYGAGYAYISSEKLTKQAIEDDEYFLVNFKELLHAYLGVPLQAEANETKQASWTVAKYPIDDDNSMVMRSLAPTYSPERPDSINWIFYNDHPAKSKSADTRKSQSANRAHAKGALLIDEDTGDAMWLSHSAPQFPPPIPDPLYFSDNSYRNGQTFICMSFDANEHGAKVIRHLANMFALVYDSYVSPKLREMIPELEQLKLEDEKSGLRSRERKASLDQSITTHGGQQFELFSKSARLDSDMYAAWLADQLDSSLYVETWRMGVGDPLDSDCPLDRFQVNNVQSMRLINGSRTLFSWPYTKDHSKWAITESREEAAVCLADINRMASQFKRGGGAICLRDPKVWTVFSNTIEELEPCRYKTKANRKPKLSSLREANVEKIKQLLH